MKTKHEWSELDSRVTIILDEAQDTVFTYGLGYTKPEVVDILAARITDWAELRRVVKELFVGPYIFNTHEESEALSAEWHRKAEDPLERFRRMV